MPKLPYMQFYVSDYLKDTRTLGLEARALWVDMLIYMFNSPRRGYLLNDVGLPIDVAQISKITGASVKNTQALLEEIKRNGVASVDENGVYFNRRMARETNLSEVRSRAANTRWLGSDASTLHDDLHMQNPCKTDANGVQGGTSPRGTPRESRTAARKSPRETRDAAREMSRGRSRGFSESESESELAAAASAALAAFPQFAAAARERFPAVDDALLAELIGLARGIHAPIADEEIMAAIQHATRPDQRSPALWRKTLPEVVKSWLRS